MSVSRFRCGLSAAAACCAKPPKPPGPPGLQPPGPITHRFLSGQCPLILHLHARPGRQLCLLVSPSSFLAPLLGILTLSIFSISTSSLSLLSFFTSPPPSCPFPAPPPESSRWLLPTSSKSGISGTPCRRQDGVQRRPWPEQRVRRPSSPGHASWQLGKQQARPSSESASVRESH